MTFKPADDKLSIGDKIRLEADVRVIKGTFTKGSILRVLGNPDYRGEFECVDIDSGERVYIAHGLSEFKKVK